MKKLMYLFVLFAGFTQIIAQPGHNVSYEPLEHPTAKQIAESLRTFTTKQPGLYEEIQGRIRLFKKLQDAGEKKKQAFVIAQQFRELNNIAESLKWANVAYELDDDGNENDHNGNGH